MKTLRINRKQIAAVFTVLALMLCACGQQAEPERDRGIAHVSISLKGDAMLDLENTTAYLCPDCLAELVAQLRGSVGGVGVVNFSTRRLYVLQESITGFGAGDYYIHFDHDAQGNKLGILITYSPLRFEDAA